MLVVIAYDVSTESKEGRRRLRRVAQTCKNYGQRVQKSLFECLVRDSDWKKLRHSLLQEFSEREDSLRFYFLDEVARGRTEHHGTGKTTDLDGILVI